MVVTWYVPLLSLFCEWLHFINVIIIIQSRSDSSLSQIATLYSQLEQTATEANCFRALRDIEVEAVTHRLAVCKKKKQEEKVEERKSKKKQEKVCKNESNKEKEWKRWKKKNETARKSRKKKEM